ncbi:MAG: hypothetical protein Q9226_004204 [Calogaya cf. arnoldii]
MHCLALFAGVASLVSAIPSKLALPGVNIQVSFEEPHKTSAVRPLTSLPNRFTLEALSDRSPGKWFGVETVKESAPLLLWRETKFLLRDGMLVVPSPGGDLAVGVTPHDYQGTVRLLPSIFKPFQMQAVGGPDGMYIEMTADSREEFGQLEELDESERIRLFDGADPARVLRLKVHEEFWRLPGCAAGPGASHKDPAIQPFASLPENFTLEASSEKLSPMPVGFAVLELDEAMQTNLKTTFFL